MDDKMIKIAIMPMAQANRLKSLSREQQIEVETFHNASTCQSGCNTTVEVWAFSEDVERISKLWQKDQEKSFSGLQYNPETINSVYDPEKETATCPACGTEFATSDKECPECGLCFG